jgi:hypothetical protein
LSSEVSECKPLVDGVVRAHFRLQRHRVMRQVLRWCDEAADPTRRRRLCDAARELAGLLAANPSGAA